MQNIIDYMWKEDWSDKLPKFYDYTQKLDESRDEQLSTVVPELTK